jgi:hypothetical protein
MRRSLIIAVFLLLFFVFVHSNEMLSFPAFIDESEHIRWASEMYDFHPFAGAHSGRLFGLWWMSLFGLQQDSALFLARISTAILSMITAAVLFDLGRRLVDTKTGSLVVLFYVLSPYAFFHERLGLTDPYVTVWAMLAAWFALRYTRRVRILDALCSGIALVAAFFSKATGITMAAIPFLIILFVASRLSWPQRLRGLLTIYGTFAAGAIGGYGFLWIQGYRYLGAASTVVGTKDTDNMFDRLRSGTEAVWNNDVQYFSLPFLVLAGLLAIYLLFRRQKTAAFLVGATLIPMAGLLAFATKHSARYFHFHMPFLLLLVAIGLGQLARDVKRRSRAASVAVMLGPLALWAALFAVPFQFTYFDDPASLDLPRQDRLEYITSDAAGFALPEVAAYLRAQADDQPMTVVGLFANCNSLDYYVPDTVSIRLICPELRWDGSHQAEVAALVNQLASDSEQLWIVFEGSVYVSLDGISVPVERQATFYRPEKLTTIEILRAEGF